MDKKDIGILIGTIISVLFLILGVAIQRWTCGGVLGSCVNFYKSSNYMAIGVLLVIAIILLALGLIFIILDLTVGNNWMGIAAVVFAFIGALLALIAMLIYYFTEQFISPILATIGMAFGVAVAIFMLMQRLSC
ncbi:unnamed protein product [Dibothriocephalus latus]|uniref:Uncharacterized protein n=1 Tax=Dibothriocephalus latus TaxID=60516 RepID=A0A3P7NUE8_DIBLA|nr:unnamed protein product [Dibothriocephalus latus]